MVCALLVIGCIAYAAPVTVYQNTSVQGLQDVFADNPGIVGFGDQILLAPGARALDSIETQVATFSEAVFADFRLTVYALDSSQNVGAALASQFLFGVSIAPNSQRRLLFTGWTISVPDEFVALLSLANTTSLVVGLEVADAASIGFSDRGFSWWQDGNGFFRQSFPDSPNNYFFIVNTNVSAEVPEPRSALLALGSIVGLLAFRRRP